MGIHSKVTLTQIYNLKCPDSLGQFIIPDKSFTKTDMSRVNLTISGTIKICF